MFDCSLSAQAVLFMLYAFFVFVLDIVEAVCINDFVFGISV
jgi:hypothetical protein